MQESDGLALGTEAWRVVDEAYPSGAAAFESCREIIDGKTHVVNPRPPLGDEFAYR